MNNPQILIIAEESSRSAPYRLPDYTIKQALVGTQALSLLEKKTFDLILIEIKTITCQSLKKVRSVAGSAKILGLIYDEKEKAEAVDLGLTEILLAPLSAEKLRPLFSHSSDGLIANSPSMQKLMQDAIMIARSDANVFIHGESGTGKEVMARFIHNHSLRHHAAFIKVNCAAIPDTLIESEFFGHEQGSFTGATSTRIGRFEAANKGSLLLDEITEVPLALQPKLLRVIQEREFERVGGVKPRKADVRLISTSNRNILESIDEKLFREDLYFRLNVIPINLPPLRQRKEDIPALIEHFLKLSCEKNRKEGISFSDGAVQKFIDYPWPGNIRELGNIVERAVVMARSSLIGPDEIEIESRSIPLVLSDEKLSLDEVATRHILNMLKLCDNNRTRAAKVLDISVRTLRNKLKKFSTTGS